jgi:GR25 family glycosyltransferase involved in LPS biosynthesis
MSPINQYFDKVFCINLDRRPDKWAESSEEFARIGLEVERVSGVDGQTLKPAGNITPGEMGCSLSHSGILKRMVENNWSKILVLEDDAVFIPNVQEYFAANLSSIPAEWDMLYFGGNHLNVPIPINPIISKITRTYTTSHYGITLNLAKSVIARVEAFKNQVDVAYSEVQASSRSYTFNPAIAWQRPGVSDIHNVFQDYTSFMKPKNL